MSDRHLAGKRKPATPKGMATRQRILDAAEAEFGRLGYDQVHVSHIVRRAGVAQGTFYLYFRSKENLLRCLMPQLGERVRQALSCAGHPPKTRTEMIGARWRAYVNLIEASPAIGRIVSASADVDGSLTRRYYETIACGVLGSAEGRVDPDTLLELVSSRQIGRDAARAHPMAEPRVDAGSDAHDIWSPLELDSSQASV